MLLLSQSPHSAPPQPIITCRCRRLSPRNQGLSFLHASFPSVGSASGTRPCSASFHVLTIFTGGYGRSKGRIRIAPRAISSEDDSKKMHSEAESGGGKRFWAAVSLIIGTAVGPGMLGMPSATIRSGPLPSTLAILLSWLYVVSSILLVAELSFALMEADGVPEVSFTSLATYTLGSRMGWLVGLIYASLSFALLVACISGIGSLLLQWFPSVHPLVANAIFPCAVGCVIGFFPFDVIDYGNRGLCFFMLLSILALVVVGVSVGRSNLLRSFDHASWSVSAILPAVPVTVLTLGFHVITPFVCKVVRSSAYEAARAILFGGTIPLVMVLSWNLVVLSFVGRSNSTPEDPIKFLLSVNAAALPAVQGFAFSALATSLIGYAVGFPKQLLDMLDTMRTIDGRKPKSSVASIVSNVGPDCDLLGSRMLGSGRMAAGHAQSGMILSSTDAIQDSELDAIDNNILPAPTAKLTELLPSDPSNPLMMLMVLGVPVIVATFFQEAFSAALDYAGVYANCFLFGVLPPVMAWIHRSRRKDRSINAANVILLPGGEISLLLLFCIAVILGIWH